MRYRGKGKIIKPFKRVLILCEGETEMNYFNGIKSIDQYRRKLSAVSVEIYKPKDHSPCGLVKEAKRRIKEAIKVDKNPYESVWVLFDKDGHANIPQAFEDARTSNTSPKINIAFSSKCFEYWIYLHYEQRKKNFDKCDELKSVIKNINSRLAISNNLFKELLESLDKALENATWLHNQNRSDIEAGIKIYELDAYTDVDKLVSALLEMTRS